MVVCGAIEFKMDKKSYRMIPLANSEDYLYNMSALTKAKQVRGAGPIMGFLLRSLYQLMVRLVIKCFWS